jgi:hypothetical protein
VTLVVAVMVGVLVMTLRAVYLEQGAQGVWLAIAFAVMTSVPAAIEWYGRVRGHPPAPPDQQVAVTPSTPCRSVPDVVGVLCGPPRSATAASLRPSGTPSSRPAEDR